MCANTGMETQLAALDKQHQSNYKRTAIYFLIENR